METFLDLRQLLDEKYANYNKHRSFCVNGPVRLVCEWYFLDPKRMNHGDILFRQRENMRYYLAF